MHIHDFAGRLFVAKIQLLRQTLTKLVVDGVILNEVTEMLMNGRRKATACPGRS